MRDCVGRVQLRVCPYLPSRLPDGLAVVRIVVLGKLLPRAVVLLTRGLVYIIGLQAELDISRT